MPTVTLRPDGTVTLPAEWTVTGAATAHAATSDDSDASYAEWTTTSSNTRLSLSLANLGIAATAQIRTVTSRVRVALAGAGADVQLAVVLTDPGVGQVDDTVTPTTTIQTISGSQRSTFNGSAWTATVVNRLRAEFVALGAGGAKTHRVFEAYIDVVYNEQPVVAVTGPADDDAGTGGVQVTTSSRPPVTWTYTDPESDVEERWEARIYATSGGGWGGFDPDTTGDTPAAQSGVVFSSALTWTPTSDIPNSVTYRAYVRAADAGSSGRYSAWAYREFTMALTPPPVPTVAATAQPASGRVKLDVTVPAGGEAASFVVVELSDDAGATWEPARGGSRLAYAGPNGATATLYDYEPPPRQARQYRAKSGRVLTGLDVVSNASATANATFTPTSWWLKDPADPTLNAAITVEPPVKVRPREPQATFDGIGRGDPITVTEGRKGFEGEIAVAALTKAAHDAVDALTETGRVLLLVDGALPRQWYVKITDGQDWTQIHAYDTSGTYPVRHAHVMTLPWVSAAKP